MGKTKKKNRKLRFIISSVLSFLLSILLTAVSVLLAVGIGFINENRILDGLNYKDYYSSVEEQFYKDARDLTLPVGLPDSVTEQIVESDQVYEDVRGYVLAAVNGKTYEFHTEELKQKLTENIYVYFREQGMELNEEQLATVPEYTQMIAEQYEQDLKVPLVNYFSKLKVMYQKAEVIVILVCLILSAIIIVVLIRMYHWKHRALRFVIYATIAAAVMTAFPAVLALESGFYKKLGIGTEYLYYAVMKYLSNGFWIFIYIACIWAAVSAGLLLFIRYLKKNS